MNRRDAWRGWFLLAQGFFVASGCLDVGLPVVAALTFAAASVLAVGNVMP